jgi:SH3-like domain-containing protein
VEHARVADYTDPMGGFGQSSRAAAAVLAAVLALAVMGAALAGVARSAEPGAAGLPRFASLRAGEVNVRTGPGVRYPVEWVFVYRNMPVEIVAEFDTWRKVRDWQGTEGWVHQSMLSGRRTAIVTTGRRALHHEPARQARIVAEVEERVVGRLLECRAQWCRVEIAGLRGWIRRAVIWGVYDGETFE